MEGKSGVGGIGREGGVIINLYMSGGNTRRECGEVQQITYRCSKIGDKATNKEEMEGTSNSQRL